MELHIEYIPVNELKPYERNNKKHEQYDIEQIAKSIEKYGMNDPIGVWKDNVIIEGHGRLEACKMLGIDTVPCIHLDHLTDEQRREYAILHNKTADLAQYDFENLALEISDLDFSEFDLNFVSNEESAKRENPYTAKVQIPQYEVQGERPTLDELYDTRKTDELISQIKNSGVSEVEKDFLIAAAKRHTIFNYRNIAEYYAQSSEEMQRLMERSALVIIDYDDAIANGYAKVSKRLLELQNNA